MLLSLTRRPILFTSNKLLYTSSYLYIRKDPPKPPKWMEKYVINTKAGIYFEKNLEKLCNRYDPQLNQRRLELYYGILETFETTYLFWKQYSRGHNINLSYDEIMQIDRFKREIGKIGIAFSPFLFIPFSFVWYFPVLCILSYSFPKIIMPAHYMRGKNSRQYYSSIHNFRKKSYPLVLNHLNNMSEKYVVPPVVKDVINDYNNGNILKINDLLEFKDYIKREDRLYLGNLADKHKLIIKSYSKTLLRMTFMLPLFSERNLKKRLQSIIYLDTILRKDNFKVFNSLDAGQLREACYIRGCNGYEVSRDIEANKYWLKNWLLLTEHISPVHFRYNEDQMSYVALMSVLWSINYTQANFERNIQ